MHLSDIATTRYTTKAFDPARKIPAETIAEIETLLRHAPSSVNLQPWHFIIAGTDAGRERIAAATQGAYTYNEQKIRNASHVVVFCVRRELDDAHLAAILEQEDRDGRFPSAEAKAGQQKSRAFYADLHRHEYKDASLWMAKQVYLALGTLLLGAATLQVDACPLEGFDAAKLDESLGLSDQGLRSVVVACLGYRSQEDFNARLPKSRLPAQAVISRI